MKIILAKVGKDFPILGGIKMLTGLSMFMAILPWGHILKYVPCNWILSDGTPLLSMIGVAVQLLGLGIMIGIGVSGKWMKV